MGLALTACSTADFAQGLPLPAERLAAFNRQLEVGKVERARVVRVAGCLATQEASLIQQRDALQTKLGPLMAQSRELQSEVLSLTTAVGLHTATRNEAQQTVGGIERQIATMPNRENYERYEQLCNVPYIGPWDRRFCANNQRWHNNALMRARADLQAAGKRLGDARVALDDATGRLSTSERGLAEASAQAVATRTQVDVTAARIATVKATQAETLLVDQPVLLAIDRLDGELRNAGELNTADERPRALGRLDAAAAQLAEQVAGAQAAIVRIDGRLGANWVGQCLGSN